MKKELAEKLKRILANYEHDPSVKTEEAIKAIADAILSELPDYPGTYDFDYDSHEAGFMELHDKLTDILGNHD